VARDQEGDGREADGAQHLYGPAVRGREVHSGGSVISSDHGCWSKK
jgi:hypothetical protein